MLNSRDVTARRRAELRTADAARAIADDVTGHVDLEEIPHQRKGRAPSSKRCPPTASPSSAEDAAPDACALVAHQGFGPPRADLRQAAPITIIITPGSGELPQATRTRKQGETAAANANQTRGPGRPEGGGGDAYGGRIACLSAPFDARSRHLGILLAISFGPNRGFDDLISGAACTDRIARPARAGGDRYLPRAGGGSGRQRRARAADATHAHA